MDHLVQRGNLAVALVEVTTTQQLHEQHTTPHPSPSQPPPTPHIHTLAPHRLTHPIAPQQHLRTSVAQRRHRALLSPPRRRTYSSLPHTNSTPVAQRDASTTVQDVRWLHIAVDDALCVRRLQHVQHLVQNRLQLALHVTTTYSHTPAKTHNPSTSTPPTSSRTAPSPCTRSHDDDRDTHHTREGWSGGGETSTLHTHTDSSRTLDISLTAWSLMSRYSDSHTAASTHWGKNYLSLFTHTRTFFAHRTSPVCTSRTLYTRL